MFDVLFLSFDEVLREILGFKGVEIVGQEKGRIEKEEVNDDEISGSSIPVVIPFVELANSKPLSLKVNLKLRRFYPAALTEGQSEVE
ncbi:hypothetical protein QL285_096488 [Trifolium repens]|nr:hypothetical protein QL285_096488 [Trifolium repens]